MTDSSVTVSEQPTPAGTVRVTIEAPLGTTVNVVVTASVVGQPAPPPLVITPAAPVTPVPPAESAPSAPAPRPVFTWRVPPTWAQAWVAFTTRLNAYPAYLRIRAWLVTSPRYEWGLFALALVVYLFTRFYAITEFPIYFFSDEAKIVRLAGDVMRTGWVDKDGMFMPFYFEAAGLRWAPVITSYVLALATEWLGKTIEVARGTATLLTVPGVVALALALRHVFKSRWWWLSILVLGFMPAWLLHSRTVFESVSAASAFALFLLCYGLYRERHPNYLYPALVFGVITFYAYSSAQLVMAVTGLLLFITDFTYHRQHVRTLLWGAGLALVLAVPLIQFQLKHAGAFETHLRAVDSYLFWDIPWTDKAGYFLSNYAYSLSANYWFFPNDTDLPRHRLLPYGQIPIEFLPLFVLGLLRAIWGWRESRYRMVLIALLVTPIGAVMVPIGITRLMTYVIPATLLIVLGFDWAWQGASQLLQQVARQRGWAWPTARSWIMPTIVGAVATAWALNLFFSTLRAAPTWFLDYGLYGMQYGSRQIFQDTLVPWLQNEPDTLFRISSDWANGPQEFIHFFIPADQRNRVMIRGMVSYFYELQPELDGRTVLVAVNSEYEQMRNDARFDVPPPELVIPYPDGQPGFYFIRPTYTAQAEAIFAAEAQARQQPITETFPFNGEQLGVTYPRLSAGSLQDAFDADAFTLIRGLESNPLYLQVDFPTPRPIHTITLTTGSMNDFSVLAQVTTADGTVTTYTERFQNSPRDPTVTVALGTGHNQVVRLRVEVTDNLAGKRAQIHIRDLQWR